jgi:hypothetical protein
MAHVLSGSHAWPEPCKDNRAKSGLWLWYLNGSDETQVGGNRMDMGWQQQNWLADNAGLC